MIRIGTRGSQLALWQANHVAGLLGAEQTELVIIKTQGDQIQNVSFDKMEGKGFFTKEIETALLDRRIDLAVHSLKDLPTESPPGLAVAAITARVNPADLLLIRTETRDEARLLKVRAGAIIGTSSLRRVAQLRHIDPTIQVEALRGNINTRLRKLREGGYDAIVLAHAGIMRLELDISDFSVHEIPCDIFLPAPAQGALGLQVRADDDETRAAVQQLNHRETEQAVLAEREFLHHFGGGCHVPLGARAVTRDGVLELTGVIAAVDGSRMIRETLQDADPIRLGGALADHMKAQGAAELI